MNGSPIVAHDLRKAFGSTGTPVGLDLEMRQGEMQASSAGTDLCHPGAVDLAAVVDSFRADGHATVRSLLGADELAPFIAVVERIAAGSRQHRVPMAERDVYHRAFVQEINLWQREAALRDLVFHQRIAEVAAALLEVDRVRLYHDQALCKEPFGGPTPWHVDQQYWPLDTDRSITAWIPLQDVTADMGPLRFARASQRIDVGRELPIGAESDRTLDEEIGRRRLAVHEDTYSLGDVSFHGGWTFHGARPNRTDRWRLVMTMIYFADGTTLLEPTRPQQHMDRRMWLPDSEVGRPIDSWLNPVVEPGVLDRLPPPAPMVGTLDLS
jgi:ectoine hydroxylase-related dioxygenase (phytanoyl-CoA dioxygenase family)